MKNNILEELKVLDDTDFIYKGELYNTSIKEWDKNSIGYIPDLVRLIADYADMSEEDEDDLLNFVQVNLYDYCIITKGGTVKDYSAAIKWELLDHTDLI